MRYLPVVLLLSSTPAFSQVAEDLQRQLQASQARSTVPGSTVSNGEAEPNPDAGMQDRLEALVMSGKCDEAGKLAKSYKNRILIRNVKQACEN